MTERGHTLCPQLVNMGDPNRHFPPGESRFVHASLLLTEVSPTYNLILASGVQHKD